MGRPSAFKSNAARAAYYRLYDESLARSPKPVEESDIQTSFGTTHVLTAGDSWKPPLVALHAKAISSTMWLPLLPTLTASHHVLMIDAVGDLNKSLATGVLASPASVVEWIDEVLDSVGIKRCAFVAASIGAGMAVNYAIARPRRVDRLAVVGPAGIVSRPYTKWVFELIKFAVQPTVSKSERLLNTITMEKSHPNLSVDPWRPIAQQFIVGLPSFRPNMREPHPVKCDVDALAASGIPILAVIGRGETLHDGPTMADRFRQQLPQAQVELVDDANHLIFIDRTEVVERQLRRFLAT